MIRGQLSTERYAESPIPYLLFDEIEKAHPDVRTFSCRLLTEGKVTDASRQNGQLREYCNRHDPKRRFIVHHKRSWLCKERRPDISSDKAMKALGEFLRPEFPSRVDEVVVFKPLTLDAYKGIAGLMIGEMKEPLLEKNITLNVSDEAL